MKKPLKYLEKVAKSFEIFIAIILLIIVAIKVLEIVLGLFEIQFSVISMDFKEILSIMLTMVIGIEFVLMLIKHTPESVITVLLFASARFLVVYHDKPIDLLIGVIAIAVLLAIKKYFIKASMISGWIDEENKGENEK
jgi:hypothetical protein